MIYYGTMELTEKLKAYGKWTSDAKKKRGSHALVRDAILEKPLALN